MRLIALAAALLPLAACAKTPTDVTTGPRVEAALVAQWPTASPSRAPAFSRNGNLAAMADASGSITIRDAHNWKALRTLKHNGGATSIVFAKGGTALISTGYDGAIRFWDLRTGKETGAIKASTQPIWSLDLSPDGSRLATAGEDAIIRIWDLKTPVKRIELRGHTQNIWEVRFSPDGKRLASCSFDYSVRLWDAVQPRLLKTLPGHEQSCVGLDYSPDGTILASGGDDAKIRYWRASDGAALSTVDNGYHVDKVAFSPDGKWLASGGHPHGMVGELWHQLTGGGGDGPAVRIWRTSDGAPVATLPHPDDAYFVAFSPDGQWLVTSAEDNRFRLWRLKTVG